MSLLTLIAGISRPAVPAVSSGGSGTNHVTFNGQTLIKTS
jgi:hypothetical protein